MNASTTPLALVTGASSGIGWELARQFAQHGFDLVVAAEDAGLVKTVRDLSVLGVRVEPVQVDLATYDGVEQLHSRVRALGRPLEAAAINAGVGVYGDFSRETELKDEINLIHLNVESTVHLAKYVASDMVRQRRGRILFVSSIAGTMPTPLEAVYGASKAFILSFADSLRNELKGTGVTVTAAIPGPTDTNFFKRAGMANTKAGAEEKNKNSAADVAKQSFNAMMAGKHRVFAASSLATKVQGAVSKFLPEDFNARLHRRQLQPVSVHH